MKEGVKIKDFFVTLVRGQSIGFTADRILALKAGFSITVIVSAVDKDDAVNQVSKAYFDDFIQIPDNGISNIFISGEEVIDAGDNLRLQEIIDELPRLESFLP